ncbi:HAD hydrolase-like protein [Azoarcus indigens]|uniref:D-glycero-D-manno-heptose 1,7-bisphosphate phosphatase n=1 Tax=Azoarcus indigens TaxID=29545 RepID=A0A4R6ECH8_9RHOO|nr:HAD hydrolase-like protein [Azoarcus indigens]NMG64267.1 HAD hydrolase-like protein [Azoarcus indigens]TDN55860.1 D-glycero-D-manno-heptose 1,7-bisphosphate phosphatase [Azoarcus indigens]
MSPPADARAVQPANRAVFIDEAGVLLHPGCGTLRADAGPALARLQRAGYRLVLIAAPDAGTAGEPCAVPPVGALAEALSPHGVVLDASYRCPHAKPAGCDCCLPGPSLLLQAAEELGLALKRSWLIGDTPDDIEAGRRAGCRTVLLDLEAETSPLCQPEHVAASLTEAVADILSTPPGARGGQAGIEEWTD